MLIASIIGIGHFINIWSGGNSYFHQITSTWSPASISTYIRQHIQQNDYEVENNPPTEQASTTTASSSENVAKKQIALTFDDGPYGTSTEMVLNILEKEDVPATFFLIGKNVEKYPDQVRREIVDGDVIGNHSYSHAKNLSTIASTTLHEDVSKAQDIIIRVSGKIPNLFRAPYSRTSPRMIGELIKEGYVMADWNIDPRDWDNNNSSSTLVSDVLLHAKNNGIIIMHDGHEYDNYDRMNIVQALPTIIEVLKKQGYVFVTIDEMLNVKPYRNIVIPN